MLHADTGHTRLGLLIEPVWNRNVVRDPVAVDMRENFLIEPVWNHGKSLNHVNPGSDLSF